MIETLGGWRSKRVGRLVVGALTLLLAIGYTLEASTMPFGSRTAPGAGMFPMGVGIACGAIALMVIVETVRRPVVEGEIDLPQGERRQLVLVFAGATTALVLVMPLLGQYIASSLYATAMIKLLSQHGWGRSLLAGTATGVVISLVFIEGFALRLPAGLILGGLL